MIASMTGFGRGTADVDGVTATIELRSVNKRFLDVATRLPQNLSERESEIQSILKQTFSRGRITVQVQVDKAIDHTLPIQVDEEAARAYGRLLETLRRVANLDASVQVADLLQFSDVFTSVEETPEDTEQTWNAIQAALTEAIDQLQAMRLQEGRALHDDLAARVAAIEDNLVQVERLAPARVEEARTRLEERLAELMQDDRLDPDRLEQEIAITADKLDITEECVRLHSHLDLFREALDNDDAVGRKLNFIVQEIHREVNTIGSKANDAEIARHVVQMKEEVEKMREQIQNVE